MSTSVPPRDGGALTGSPGTLSLLLGDELALRRAFDSEYSTCIESARTQLGDAGSQAPRIVETAFVNAWNQRALFATGDQLKSFLSEEVKHGASRFLSRRAAAHRFGTHGGRDEIHTGTHGTGSATVDAERSWGEITRALHAESHSEEAHAAVASAGRHEAAEHMKAVAKTGSWKIPVAIGVVAIAAMVIAFFYLDRLGEGEAAFSAVSAATIQPIASQSGQIGTTKLADGSKVRLGPDSKIFIPEAFPKTLRAVRVEGTVQFDVAPNQPLPFRVIVRKSQVVATGTSFVVSAFPADSDAGFGVLVKEGTVNVEAGKATKSLAANQTALVGGTTIKDMTDAQRTEAFGWVDGKVTVENKPLRDVVVQLVRWFNLDIKIPDSRLLDRPASFSVSLDSSRAAITQIEKSGNVKFAYEGETKVFRDAPVKPSKK